MITYDRYTELLSKRINRTITDSERNDVAKFEAAQPPTCPRCGASLRSYFIPDQIVHDSEKCDRPPVALEKA